MRNDLLAKIIKTELSRKNDPTEKSNDFIYRVTHICLNQISERGFTPEKFRDELFQEIEAHAIIVYRKMTYGYLSLQEYREQKLKHLPAMTILKSMQKK